MNGRTWWANAVARPRYAGRSERRDAARTFVLIGVGAVVGYYALLAGGLDHHEASEPTRKGMSRHYPIPVAILALLRGARFVAHRRSLPQLGGRAAHRQ